MTVPPAIPDAARAAIRSHLTDRFRDHGAPNPETSATRWTNELLNAAWQTGWTLTAGTPAVTAQPATVTPRTGPGRPRNADVDRQIVRLIADDLTNAEIAELVGLSESSVKNRVARLVREYGARHRTGLIIRAIAAGHITVSGTP